MTPPFKTAILIDRGTAHGTFEGEITGPGSNMPGKGLV